PSATAGNKPDISPRKGRSRVLLATGMASVLVAGLLAGGFFAFSNSEVVGRKRDTLVAQQPPSTRSSTAAKTKKADRTNPTKLVSKMAPKPDATSKNETATHPTKMEPKEQPKVETQPPSPLDMTEPVTVSILKPQLKSKLAPSRLEAVNGLMELGPAAASA